MTDTYREHVTRALAAPTVRRQLVDKPRAAKVHLRHGSTLPGHSVGVTIRPALTPDRKGIVLTVSHDADRAAAIAAGKFAREDTMSAADGYTTIVTADSLPQTIYCEVCREGATTYSPQELLDAVLRAYSTPSRDRHGRLHYGTFDGDRYVGLLGFQAR